MRIKAAFLGLLVSCSVLWALSMPTHAYNSPSGDAPNVAGGGHPWITNQAIDYLKRIDPFAYAIANRYRQQIVYGSWYADHNSGRCDLRLPLVVGGFPPQVIFVPISHSINCDSTNHYEPRYHFTVGIGFVEVGLEGTINAAAYAGDLYAAAEKCLPFLNVPERSLPADCAVPEWRRINPINIFSPGDTPDFVGDGPLTPHPASVLLGWALHMLEDQTQVYHTFNQGFSGHQEFENWVDDFIKDGSTNANQLPDDTSQATLEVPTAFSFDPRLTAELFTLSVAEETRNVSDGVLNKVFVGGNTTIGFCCDTDKTLTDDFAKASLNRAIVYTAKLIRYYFRNQTKQLSNAIMAVIDN